MLEPFAYPFFQRAFVAALLASVACGVVGSLVLVRRISSISGGLSHAAFGGVGLAYLVGFDPLVGATGFALASAAAIGAVERRMRPGLDTLVAMIWSIGMALGIVFVSLTPGYAPDLLSYLFGSLLFVPERYVYLLAGLDVVILAIVSLLFKEFQAICFDEEQAQIAGVPVAVLQQVLLALVALVVVVMIRVVGVILVIALLTIPAATARQWSDRLPRMMLGATLLGALCSVVGLELSYWLAEWGGLTVPTGPAIVLVAGLVYAASAIVRFARVPRAQASLLLPLLLVISASCAPVEREAETRPTVAVSVPPQAYFVERLAGDLVEVEVMLPPGANPSTHNPTMPQMKAVAHARIYVKVGHPAWPFESAWLDRLLAESAAPVVVDGARGEACKGEDPHLWLSPACVRATSADLARALITILPEHRERIEREHAAFERELDELDAEIRRTLAGVQGRTLFVQHPSWGSFARDYGLVQLSIESERKEPSPAELADIIATARERGVRDIFVQPQFAPLAADTVALELGARLRVVDPLSRDWADNLRQVSRIFAEALAPTPPEDPT